VMDLVVDLVVDLVGVYGDGIVLNYLYRISRISHRNNKTRIYDI
jgi:hypothetical protein